MRETYSAAGSEHSCHWDSRRRASLFLGSGDAFVLWIDREAQGERTGVVGRVAGSGHWRFETAEELIRLSATTSENGD